MHIQGVSQSRKIVYKLTAKSLIVGKCSINVSLNVDLNKLNINLIIN